MKKCLNIKKKAPTILSVLSAGGVVVTAIFTAQATTKAIKLIEKNKEETNVEELTKTEIICETWKCYIPAAIIGVSTIVCILSANALNKHQQAIITSAYSLVSNSYNEYKSKLKELYGEEAHKNIMDAIAKEKCEDIYISASGFIKDASLDFEEHNSDDNRLFYDFFSKRYFETSVNRVIQAEYHLNRNFVLRGYVTLNEFYEFLGLQKLDFGDEIGWSCYDSEIYWLDFYNYKTTMDDGLECYIIDFMFEPTAEQLEDI